LTKRTSIASHAAAIDTRLVLILEAIVARANCRARFRARVAIHRGTITVCRAISTKRARTTLRSTAIDIGFVLVFDVIATRRRGNTFGRVRIARSARAIGILRTGLANVTRVARAAAAIDIRLGTIEEPIIAGGASLAHHTRRIA